MRACFREQPPRASREHELAMTAQSKSKGKQKRQLFAIFASLLFLLLAIASAIWSLFDWTIVLPGAIVIYVLVVEPVILFNQLERDGQGGKTEADQRHGA